MAYGGRDEPLCHYQLKMPPKGRGSGQSGQKKKDSGQAKSKQKGSAGHSDEVSCIYKSVSLAQQNDV